MLIGTPPKTITMIHKIKAERTRDKDVVLVKSSNFFLWNCFLCLKILNVSVLLIYVVLLFCSQYLSELLAEHQKLGPFMQVLPICSRLLNQGVFLNL
jgi:hypothetical protein